MYIRAIELRPLAFGRKGLAVKLQSDKMRFFTPSWFVRHVRSFGEIAHRNVDLGGHVKILLRSIRFAFIPMAIKLIVVKFSPLPPEILYSTTLP